MAQTFNGRKRVRKFFGNISEVAQMPNLIEVQRASYDQFLQVEKPEAGRLAEGLQAVFNSVFPISDFSGSALLEFADYEFEPPKYDVEECRQRGMTYAAPLKVTLRLIVFDIDEDTGAKSVKDIKEQDVYMGDMPLMTLNGTFVINGTERVIVSQMHRSPGVFFDHDKGKTHSSGKLLFAARIIPLPRLLARYRIRRQGHRPCAYRPQTQNPGHVACYRRSAWIRRRFSTPSLTVSSTRAPMNGWRVPFDAQRMRGYKGRGRSDQCRYRRGRAGGRPQVDGANRQQTGRWRPEGLEGDR